MPFVLAVSSVLPVPLCLLVFFIPLLSSSLPFLLHADQSIPSSSFGPLLAEVLCSFAACTQVGRDFPAFVVLFGYAYLAACGSPSPLRQKKTHRCMLMVPLRSCCISIFDCFTECQLLPRRFSIFVSRMCPAVCVYLLCSLFWRPWRRTFLCLLFRMCVR